LVLRVLERCFGKVGVLQLKNANVRWFLSINAETLPEEIRAKEQRTYRTITIDNEELEFSAGFTDLHTESYKNIVEGNGFGINETMQSLELAYNLRNAKVEAIDYKAWHIFSNLHDFYPNFL